MDNDLLGKIFSVASALWAMFCINAAFLFRAWPLVLGRLNERRRDAAMEKDQDWKRVRAERDRYHELLVKCQTDRNEWMGRAVRAEAFNNGIGEARQEAARIVAVERLTDAAKKTNGNGET